MRTARPTPAVAALLDALASEADHASVSKLIELACLTKEQRFELLLLLAHEEVVRSQGCVHDVQRALDESVLEVSGVAEADTEVIEDPPGTAPARLQEADRLLKQDSADLSEAIRSREMRRALLSEQVRASWAECLPCSDAWLRIFARLAAPEQAAPCPDQIEPLPTSMVRRHPRQAHAPPPLGGRRAVHWSHPETVRHLLAA